MAGASEDHNLISLNLAFALRTHLRGGRCRVNVADVKVRLQISAEDVFYYPDVMVACDPRNTDPYFKRFPQVLIEVLSPQTEPTDRRVGQVHEAAAVFDDESLAAATLDVRQRFQQHRGFGNEVLHRISIVRR